MNIAALESDLLRASAAGLPALRNVIFSKLGSLIEDEHDLEAVLDAVMDYQESKTADGPAAQGAGFMAAMKRQPWPAYLALASLAAAPVAAGARFLSNKNSKDTARQNLMMTAPDLFAKDPARAQALFELLHSTAPHLAQNTVVAKDLMSQMMSMPQVDLGTAKTLTEMRNKDRGSDADGGAKILSAAAGTFGKLGKEAAYTPVLNWATPAMKSAGITSLFTGSGTPAQQADNATNFQMEQAGMPVLPLDSIIQELMAKEQELAVRADTIAQQEMQMQQAMQAMQGVQGAYNDQYGGGGPDAASMLGMTPPQPPVGGPMPDQQAAGQEDGQPPAGQEGDPNAQDPNAAAAAQDPNAQLPPDTGAGDPNAQLPPEQVAEDPNAQLPPEQVAEDPNAQLPPDQGADDPNAQLPPEAAGDPNAPPSTDGQDLVGGAGPATTEGFPPEAGSPEPTAIPTGGDVGAVDAGGADVGGGNVLNVTVPLPSLQISVKLAEQVAEDRMQAARQAYQATLNDIFRP
jgi:hypothetical protein